MAPMATRHQQPSSGTSEQPEGPVDRLTAMEEQLSALLDRQTALELENNTLRDRLAVSTPIPVTNTVEEATLTTDPSNITQAQVRVTPEPERHLSEVPTVLTSTTNSRSSEPKVANPEYYQGQRNKLSTFITQVAMVIALQPSRFPNEKSKVLYAGSYLRDTAFLWFQPWVTATPPPSFMTDFQEFCHELRRTFGDPDEVATAERHLYTLRQKGSASSYVADFTRYAVLVHWNDEAKASQFYRGLKDFIKDEMAKTGRPSSLRALQEAAIRLDNRVFERQIEKGEHMGNNFSQSTRPSQFREQTTTTKTQHTFTPRLRATVPAQAITKRGKLTPAEYQRRKDNNLCLYCGDKGHSVSNCPKAPQQGANKIRSVQDSTKSLPSNISAKD